MQLGKNALGQRTADPGHARQIVHACRLHTSQAAKMCEQRAPPGRADAADVLQ
jgi:hypothetical protein